MKVHVLAIHDKKAEVFGQPIFVPAVGIALREFTDIVNDGKSEYAKHPEDYTLFALGTFDNVLGIFEAPELGKPDLVITAVSVVKSDPRQLSLLKEKEA